ncbi:MAG: gliding motility-associated C-terminal domain-containing protein [Saprospiraceae bacterium]|nr:gliding motility-associated C-terminal domain-containing protein [Saprospiraceae bacterium]
MRKLYAVLVFCCTLNAATLAQCPITVNAGDDIYLCTPPAPTELNGSIDGDYLSFAWTPLSGLSGANTLSPGVSVTQTTTYVLTGSAVDPSTNLIANGDFEGGNSDFSSDYVYNPGDLVPEGYYDVLANPQDDHPGFQPCNDHTSGSGNMMVVNGAGTPNQDVWCQTVAVMPNTQYAFSAWVTTVVAASPALLQFSINGQTIGPIFSAPNQTCVWQNFYQIWNSGSASSATICIVNMNTTLGGNDFALDDISFSPVCRVTDTVVVHVVNVVAVASPSVIMIPCEGATLTLSGVGSSTGVDYSYEWTTPDGNIVSGANTLNPVVNMPGQYVLTVRFEKDGYTCEKTAIVNVLLNPNPLLAWITPPQPIGCGSSGNTNLVGNSNQGAVSWQWSTLDGNIVSGATSKTAVVNAPGTYELLVTNIINGCTTLVEVTVTTATNPPVANASAGTITCTNMSTVLSGAGSSTGNNITYSWTTPNGSITSGQNTQNAVAGATGTYYLQVTNTSNNCVALDTVTVSGNLTPPAPSIQTPGTFTCVDDTLSLSGALNPANSTFAWSASGGGNIAGGGNTLNPQINAPGTYSLSATNPANGCTASVSVTVGQNTQPPAALIQPADSITCQSPSISLDASGSSSGPTFSYQWTASNGGNLVSGDTTLTPLVNAAGNYTLLITNNLNGCTTSASIPVTADQNVVSAVANAPDTLSCATGTILLDANGSSSGASISYAWTTVDGNILLGGNTPNPSVDEPGTYQLLVTNSANGCSATDLVVVQQNIATPALQINTPDELTCANPVQTLQAQNQSAPGNFVYSWATAGGNILSGDSTLAPQVNAPGAYTLTAFNLDNGCSSQVSTTVDLEVGTPTAVIAAPPTLTCTLVALTLNTSGSSTGAEFTYQWLASGGGNISGGDGTPAPSVDAPGQYALTVTNTQNGCTATTSITVNEDVVAPPADAGPTALLTCNDPVFSLVANNGQTDPNLVYQWTSPDGNFVGSPGAATVDCDEAGEYFIQITNLVNGCVSVDSVTITANQQIPDLNIALPATLTCTTLNTQIQASASGSSAILQYDWQSPDGQFVSGQTQPNPTVDAPGTYLLTVTDPANGCSTTGQTTVLQDITPPDATIAAPQILNCTLTQFNLQGDGTGDATWTTADGNIISGGDQFGPTLINAPGTYVLTAVDPVNGCTTQTSVTVSQNIQPPAVSAGNDATLSCAINSLTLTGSGNGQGVIAYAWTAASGGNILGGANTSSPSIDAPGIYNLTVTDPVNGCTATDAVQILEDANAPQANAGPATTLNCLLTQITLGGSGSAGPGISYVWTASGGGNILSGANSLSPLIDAPGAYELLVSNANNGCTATATVVIPEDIAQPVVDAGVSSTLTCAQTSASLSGSATAGNGGSLQFNWQTNGGTILSGANTATPSVGAPGVYTLTVQNQLNGCSATDQTTVGIDTISPAISAAAPQIITCNQPQVALAGQVQQPVGGFSAQWSTANGNIVSGTNTLNPMVDLPGTYVLSVQNQQNGCTSTATANVQQNVTPPVAQIAPATLITCDQPQISLNASGSMSIESMSFAWTAGNGGLITAGANSATPTVVAAGAYTLTVTNQNNGCTDIATQLVNIDTLTPPTAILSPLPLTCQRDTVTLNAGASATGPNFSASWTTPNGNLVGGQNTLFPQANQPGLYILVVENVSTGCTGTANITLTEDVALPQADAGPPAMLDCSLPQATLQGSSVTQATLGFQWSTANGQIVSGANTATPVAATPGQYQLTVTNLDNGCTATDQVLVGEIPPPVFVPGYDHPNCLNPLGAIDFGTVTGGTAPFRYSIDGGQSFQNSPVFLNLDADSYQLMVTDDHGCTDTDQVTLNEPVYPSVTLPASLIIELGDSQELVPVTTPPIFQIASWQWSPADYLSCADCPSPTVMPLRNTKYELTITDLNGCTASAPVQVRVNRQKSIYAPNIFSPNGDGANDFFKIFGKGVADIRNLAVFDRWGNQVFLVEHLDPLSQEGGWDGRYRGSELNPGVFVWQAVVEFIDGEVLVFAGDVTLER